MNRRNFLKVAGAGGAAAAASGIGIIATTGSATAAEFTISDPSAIATDDGTVNYVRLEANHEATWDGFDSDAQYVRYYDDVTVRPNTENETQRINDTGLVDLSEVEAGNWGGDGEYGSGPGKAGHIHADIDWNIIGDPDASDPSEGGPRSVESPADLLNLLAAEEDGSTQDSKIVLTKRVRFYDVDENPLTGPNGEYDDAVAEDSFVVSVENEAGTTGSSGGGEPSMGGDDEDPHSSE
jgi:hypothetical protein